ncbi:MAG: Polymorphic outer membrane protein [Candidatus Roizmanbacteria bacterium GW2011_GWC2_37_13]|uniref:Polymorphic outer membrane protein n=1 Tax=Candidatus Roizmanbacteria bacterium GW2011_GWC2_37_13 TaxID=1618486 RepID=A0A0G0JA73_9BACT|nr:MAG: Polymorphic outer membrane protein [Candidatus Roizmanbacteria bacterium GW2011_GWC1_37_12]KKQ25086.1 MAG: Polymorphic outer membrane protein [Candidatus Roizmanbacteria bacterium GW2011_GWC2_37_13]
MKRSELFQKNKLTRTITVFIIILIVTLLLVFTIGFKLLLNTSIFVANLFSKTSAPALNKTEEIYGSIIIDNIPTATNSAKFIISGSVINYEKLAFFLNGEKVKEIDLKSSDNFSEEIGDLEKGSNKVYIKASSSDNKSKKTTNTYSVLFKEEKPKLDITQPKDKETISQSEILLKGLTDKEVFIRVNDLPVVVDAVGNFQTNIRLKEGENLIEIVASDIAGNIETKNLNVIYQKE